MGSLGLLFCLLAILFTECDAARDPGLYCSACRIVIDEVQHKIGQVDPKKKIQVGSFRVDPSGNQARYEVPYARSESHLTEVFEGLCSSISNLYAKSNDKSTGKNKFVRTSSRSGETLSLSNVEISGDSSRQLTTMCEHLLEEHEEDFIRVLQKYNDSESPEQACVNIADACLVEDLSVPLVNLADPNEQDKFEEHIENLKADAKAQPMKEDTFDDIPEKPIGAKHVGPQSEGSDETPPLPTEEAEDLSMNTADRHEEL